MSVRTGQRVCFQSWGDALEPRRPASATKSDQGTVVRRPSHGGKDCFEVHWDTGEIDPITETGWCSLYSYRVIPVKRGGSARVVVYLAGWRLPLTRVLAIALVADVTHTSVLEGDVRIASLLHGYAMPLAVVPDQVNKLMIEGTACGLLLARTPPVGMVSLPPEMSTSIPIGLEPADVYSNGTQRWRCLKCGSESGDDWSQCGGVCPVPGSLHHREVGEAP